MCSDEKQAFNDPKAIADTYVEWLSPVPWQVFCTATFPWKVRGETADKKLNQLLESLQDELRVPIGFLSVRERLSRKGDDVGWHFHLLLTCLREIPHSSIVRTWRRLAHLEGATIDIPIEVEPYDPTRGGLRYHFKWLHVDSEVALGNLDLYDGSKRNTGHAHRRRYRRFDHLKSQIGLYRPLSSVDGPDDAAAPMQDCFEDLALAA